MPPTTLDWFHRGYRFRRQLPITAGSAISTGQIVEADVDLEALVTAGQMIDSVGALGWGYEDLRLCYWNGTRFVPLNLEVVEGGQSIKFAAVANISGGATDPNYYLFHGYPLIQKDRLLYDLANMGVALWPNNPIIDDTALPPGGYSWTSEPGAIYYEDGTYHSICTTAPAHDIGDLPSPYLQGGKRKIATKLAGPWTLHPTQPIVGIGPVTYPGWNSGNPMHGTGNHEWFWDGTQWVLLADLFDTSTPLGAGSSVRVRFVSETLAGDFTMSPAEPIHLVNKGGPGIGHIYWAASGIRRGGEIHVYHCHRWPDGSGRPDSEDTYTLKRYGLDGVTVVEDDVEVVDAEPWLEDGTFIHHRGVTFGFLYANSLLSNPTPYPYFTVFRSGDGRNGWVEARRLDLSVLTQGWSENQYGCAGAVIDAAGHLGWIYHGYGTTGSYPSVNGERKLGMALFTRPGQASLAAADHNVSPTLGAATTVTKLAVRRRR